MKNLFSTIQKKSRLPTKDLISLNHEKENFLELRVDEVDSCLDILETYIKNNRTPAHSFYYIVITTFRLRVDRIDEIFSSIRYSSPEISKLKLIDLESDIMELRKQINSYLNIFSNGLEKIQ
jgi:hypothetical protein